MAYPYTQLLGDATVSVTSTASAAVNGTTAKMVGITLGLPVLEQISELANMFGIPRSAQLSSKSKILYKVTFNGSDLVLGQTFAAQGVHPGSSIVLADA